MPGPATPNLFMEKPTMLHAIKQFLLPPTFHGDENKTRMAGIIHFLILTTFVFSVFVSIAVVVLYEEKTINVVLCLTSFGVLFGLYSINRRGHYRLASFLYIAVFWSMSSAVLYLGSQTSSPQLGFYIAITVTAGVMLGMRWAMSLAVLNILVVLFLALLEINGYPFPHYFPEAPLVRWFDFSLFLFFTIMPLYLILTGLSDALKRARQENEHRKKAEQSTRTSEKYFRALIENSQDIITVLDDAGNICFASPSNERILGYKSEELVGQNIFDFIHSDDCRMALDVFQRCMKKAGSSQTAEFRIKHCDGSLRHLEVIGQSLLHIPEVHGVVINSRDVTERKLLKEQFLQAQKMESIGRLAGGVAHDFNNVLTTILGYSELLLAEMPDNDPHRESIELIHSAGRKASALTRQLLAFSRKQILEKKVVCVNTIINDFLKILSKMLGEDIEVKTCLEAEKGIIEADPGQIEQILMNLTVNARDAMPNGGDILIETKDTLVTEDYSKKHLGVLPGNYVMLAVTDSGTGIDKKEMEHIFEPFFTTKEEGKGTGLGLATVHGITKQHNGHVHVYSEKGKGSTFKIYLPASNQTIKSNISHHKTIPLKQGRETIMIVDDEPSVCRLVADTLEPLGYKCLGVSSGKDAIELLKNYPDTVHLLLTDVVMPGINGSELAERIRATYPDLKIIFMSGYTENTITHRGVLDKGINYISKPITPVALTHKIRSVLGKSPSEL